MVLLALTEVPVFQSSVFFQVAVSAAKAVDFPNYGVEIFIAWLCRIPSAFIHELQESDDHHSTSLYLHSPKFINHVF